MVEESDIAQTGVLGSGIEMDEEVRSFRPNEGDFEEGDVEKSDDGADGFDEGGMKRGVFAFVVFEEELVRPSGRDTTRHPLGRFGDVILRNEGCGLTVVLRGGRGRETDRSDLHSLGDVETSDDVVPFGKHARGDFGGFEDLQTWFQPGISSRPLPAPQLKGKS